MANKPRDYENELSAIINAVAKREIEQPDQETLEDAQDQGIDIHKDAESVRRLFHDSLKSFRQKKLLAAEAAYQRDIEQQKSKHYALPSTPEQRRASLWSIFKVRPELTGMLTAQHREFKDLRDEDVESLLKQLQDLGIKIKTDDDS